MGPGWFWISLLPSTHCALTTALPQLAPHLLHPVTNFLSSYFESTALALFAWLGSEEGNEVWEIRALWPIKTFALASQAWNIFKLLHLKVFCGSPPPTPTYFHVKANEGISCRQQSYLEKENHRYLKASLGPWWFPTPCISPAGLRSWCIHGSLFQWLITIPVRNVCIISYMS